MANDGFMIEIQGLDQLVAKAAEAGDEMTALLLEAMIRSTDRVKQQIQDNITSKGITNTGNLSGSVDVVEVSPERGVVGVGEDYGAYVEFGTDPHWPPVDAIERWAQTKLGVPGLGFIIARKISKVGTKAQPYVRPAFESEQDFVLQQFAEVGEKIVASMA